MSGRMTLVRSTASLRLSWRSSSLTTAGSACKIDDGVDAFGLLVDLVREPPPTPHIDLLHVAAALADHVEELVEAGRNGALLEVRVKDDHHLVTTHALPHLLWTRTATADPWQEGYCVAAVEQGYPLGGGSLKS